MSLEHFALNWIDDVIIAVIVLSVIISIIRGFVKEALSLVAWIAAIIIASRFALPLSQLFAKHVSNVSLRLGISFILLLIVTLILGGLLNFLISQLVVKSGLSGTNRLIGFIFGLLRGVVVIAALLLLAQLTTIPASKAWQQSILVPKIEPVAKWLKVFVPETLGPYFKFRVLPQKQQDKK